MVDKTGDASSGGFSKIVLQKKTMIYCTIISIRGIAHLNVQIEFDEKVQSIFKWDRDQRFCTEEMHPALKLIYPKINLSRAMIDILPSKVFA